MAAARAPQPPPISSLFIRNLPFDVRTLELKKTLYQLFSEYGAVLDIYCSKRSAVKGKAWVTFKDASTCAAALRGAENQVVYGRAMVIELAKERGFVLDPALRVKRDKRRQLKKEVEARAVKISQKRQRDH